MGENLDKANGITIKSWPARILLECCRECIWTDLIIIFTLVIQKWTVSWLNVIVDLNSVARRKRFRQFFVLVEFK